MYSRLPDLVRRHSVRLCHGRYARVPVKEAAAEDPDHYRLRAAARNAGA